MKTSLRTGAALLMAFGLQTAAFTGAFADKETGIPDFIDDFCKPRVESGEYESVGQCMGQARQEVVALCKDNWEAADYRNNGQCEKAVQQIIKDNDYS